jgi:hypothetical protein
VFAAFASGTFFIGSSILFPSGAGPLGVEAEQNKIFRSKTNMGRHLRMSARPYYATAASCGLNAALTPARNIGRAGIQS